MGRTTKQNANYACRAQIVLNRTLMHKELYANLVVNSLPNLSKLFWESWVLTTEEDKPRPSLVRLAKHGMLILQTIEV